MKIRRATLGDLPYVYDICAKTAVDGQDARKVMSDVNKVGHYFAAPYLHYDLSSCFVLTQNGIAKGYILGSTDTQQFTTWLNKHWLTHIRELYPIDGFVDDSVIDGFDAFLNSVIHNETHLDNRVTQFDAHFHIDLLPEFQNAGWGKKLIDAFFQHCKKQQVDRCHITVSKTHVKALGFYDYLGFKQLYRVGGAIVLGIEISQ